MKAKPHDEFIDGFVASLRRTNPDDEFAVLLIGSAARDCATAQSDLDLLVIASSELTVVRTADRLHVQYMKETEFVRRLQNGDDFAAWCVRFGLPIVPAAVWTRILESPDVELWPDWHRKLDHAARRLLLARALIDLGDGDAAAEELLYAVSHVARAILLRDRVFPLSRPEMIKQLADADNPQLATLLQQLILGPISESGMRRAFMYIKKLLVHLDRGGYERYVSARREIRREKSARVGH